MNSMKRLAAIWTLVLAVAAAMAIDASHHSREDLDRARQAFLRESAAAARQNMTSVHNSLRGVYDHLLILTSLSAIRDNHEMANALSEDERLNLQQIFNRMAARVPVSALVISGLPRTDDAVGAGLIPPIQPKIAITGVVGNLNQNLKVALKFDAAPTVRPREGSAISQQAKWFRAIYPQLGRINDQTTPLLVDVVAGDPEEASLWSNVRPRNELLVFSSPYYDHGGEIAGVVSVFIKDKALAALLPPGNYALVSPGNHLLIEDLAQNSLDQSTAWLAKAKRDPNLIYSEAIPLFLPDSRDNWYFWASQPDEAFINSEAVGAISASLRKSLWQIAAIAAAVMAFAYLVEKSLRQSTRLNATLAAARDQAERSSAESRETAGLFSSLNDDITRLNIELSDKVKALAEAQAGVREKCSMAELGRLISRVAQELSIPLAAMEATGAALAATLTKDSGPARVQMDRMQAGLRHCHHVVRQLNDLACDQKPDRQRVVIDAWLEEFLASKAQELPEVLELTCNLGLNQTVAEVDAARLGRALAALIDNGVDAMIGSDGAPLRLMAGRKPRLNVTTNATIRGIEIVVNDNGPGMDAHVLHQAGTPLFSTKPGGVGLGLAAARKAMALHGGGLDIASVKGTGARFALWFPASAAASKAA